MLKIAFFYWLLIALCACEEPGGVSVQNKTLGQTVTVNSDKAQLVISATYKVGLALVEVSITNKGTNRLIPSLTTNNYCYLVSIKDASGNQVATRHFDLDKFESQFDSAILIPGLTYTEFEWIYPWQLPNDWSGGRVKIEVWLAEENKPEIVYYLWGEVNLQNI